MKRLSPLTIIFMFFAFFLFSTVSQAQKQFSSWKKFHENIDERPTSLKGPYLQIKEAINLPNKKLKGISSISILKVSSNTIIALMCSDDPKESQWFRVKIEMDKGLKIKNFEVLEDGFLMNQSGENIGGVEGTEIYEGNFYVSLDNDIKGEKRNFILKYELSKRAKEWSATEKIELVKASSFPTSGAYENAGLEALTVTDDGSIFTIYELGNGNEREAWLKNPYHKELAATSFKYTAQDLEVKGATTRPNGNIVILEKEYHKIRGTRFSIQELDRKRLNKVTYLDTKELLRTDFDTAYFDNFEGIACFEMNKKECILVVSDDNGRAVQNTLLFLFERTDPNASKSDTKINNNETKTDNKTEKATSKKAIDPTLIPYPRFSKNESSIGNYVDPRNRQIIYDTKLGASLIRAIGQDGVVENQRVYGIPRHANVSVAITPRTLRGIVEEEVKYFTVSMEGKDHLFKNSIQDLFKAVPTLSSSGSEEPPKDDDNRHNEASKALGMLGTRSNDKAEISNELATQLDKVEATLSGEERSNFTKIKEVFIKNPEDSSKKELETKLQQIINRSKGNNKAMGGTRALKAHLDAVFNSWEKGDQQFQYSDIQTLTNYKDSLSKAVYEWQSSGKDLSLKEIEAFNRVMNWLPHEIYLTTFSSIAPDKDEVEIKLKTFGENSSAVNEFQIAKKRISTGLAINLGTAFFLTGLKSNEVYLNDSFPTSDTTIERRVMLPTKNQLSVGFGANAELSFRTPSIVRPMVSLGFFVPLNEKVTPLFALGGGVTIGTQKVKLSASFGVAFGSVTAIKEEYVNRNVPSTIQVSEVTENVWDHSWQVAIGISYNLVNPN